MNILKKTVFLLPLTLTMLPCHAQYPQLSKEARAKIDSMQAAWAKHQAEVWAKCEPIVKKEHAGPAGLLISHRQRFPLSLVLRVAACTLLADVAERFMLSHRSLTADQALCVRLVRLVEHVS